MNPLLKTLISAAALWLFPAGASPQPTATLHTYEFPTGYLSGMSDNGKWALYKTPDYDEEDAVPRRLDLTKGIIEEMPVDKEQNSWGAICVCRDISDDGETIVGSYNNMPAYYHDGTWHELPLPREYRGYTGDVYSVTPDGTMMCGWVSVSFTDFKPIIWKEGEVVELGNLPTYEEMKERGIISRGDYSEHRQKGQTPNLAFFKISADGKQVLSGVDHNYPGWGASYIVYHVETGDYDWIADDSIHGECFVDGASMSNNGEWCSAMISGTIVNPDGTWDNDYSHARYHIPTGTFERVPSGGIIDNNGVCYGAGIPSGNVVVPLDQILSQKYGIDFYKATGFDTTGHWFDISSDTRTLIAMPYPRLYAYSVTLPITLTEAAEGVNLLSTYECFPEKGAELCRLSNVRITLPYACVPTPGMKALLSSEGSTIAESVAIEGKRNVWSLIFPETRLSTGQRYTISLPEGMFTVEGHPSSSPAIEFSYTGREEKPLAPTAVAPREGSAIIELGLYNMISMTFPASVAVTAGAEALLYEKDASDPLARLNLVAEDATLYAYPPATRKLSKGREYVVKIAEGSVTDISGYCPNEEIVLNYQGAYQVKPPSSGSEYLFFDDFSAPYESLGNFLLYEGDHLRPDNRMQALGFDADNTPWNFSVRDDDDYDYCAAATSIYTEAKPADDWMVLPRLNIANPFITLTFKSQSYAYSAADRLKVIVWECDEVFGSLDADIIARMKEEGTVVYDELQNPGAQQEMLAGDWRHNRISLAPWSGKNVYIAFLNDNTRQSMLFVDDVAVIYEGNYSLECSAPTAVVAESSVPLSVKVTVNNDISYDSLTASVASGATTLGCVEFDALSLGKDDEFEFSFPGELPLTPGEINSFTLSVTLGNETRTMDFDIKDLMFEPARRVLVEEGTGGWCGWCPLGMVALDYLETAFPGQVAEVAVHCRDAYSFDGYDQFLNLGAYPNGRVNRSMEVCAPFCYDANLGAYSLSSSSGNETFVDFVEKALATPAEIGISVELDGAPERNMANIIVNVCSALNREADFNLLLVVTEDGLPGVQSNYLSGGTDPLFGEWADADPTTLCTYKAVARSVASSGFYGDSGLLPSVWKAGDTFTLPVAVNLPDNLEDIRQCHIVAVLISPANGEAVNSAVVALGAGAGVEGTPGDYQPDAGFFSAVGGTILFNGSTEGVEVYSLQGFPQANAGLSGPCIARHGRQSAIVIAR